MENPTVKIRQFKSSWGLVWEYYRDRTMGDNTFSQRKKILHPPLSKINIFSYYIYFSCYKLGFIWPNLINIIVRNKFEQYT